MKHCWPDGDLRAYLDGELSLESQEQLAAHLDLCGECSARHREISGRAARVSNLFSALSEGTPVAVTLPSDHRRRWIVAAVSLAAALAIGFILLPRHRVIQPAPIAPAPTPVVAIVPVQPSPRPAVGRATVHRPALREDFLRLDDDPIE